MVPFSVRFFFKVFKVCLNVCIPDPISLKVSLPYIRSQGLGFLKSSLVIEEDMQYTNLLFCVLCHQVPWLHAASGSHLALSSLPLAPDAPVEAILTVLLVLCPLPDSTQMGFSFPVPTLACSNSALISPE